MRARQRQQPDLGRCVRTGLPAGVIGRRVHPRLRSGIVPFPPPGVRRARPTVPRRGLGAACSPAPCLTNGGSSAVSLRRARRAQRAILAEHTADDLVEITGDDLREYHPDFARLADHEPFAMPGATAPVSGCLVARALDYACRRRCRRSTAAIPPWVGGRRPPHLVRVLPPGSFPRQQHDLPRRGQSASMPRGPGLGRQLRVRCRPRTRDAVSPDTRHQHRAALR